MTFPVGHRQCRHLGGLRLAGASRSCRRATKLEVERSSEGEVAAVSEGGNDQTPGVAEVLEPVRKLGVDGAYVQELVGPVVAVHMAQRRVVSQ